MFDLQLKNAIREEGCPLCRVRRQAIARYIYHTLWENVGDPVFRQRFLAAEGLCPQHAWQLQSLEAEQWRDGLGTASLYSALLVNTRRQLALDRQADIDSSRRRFWWQPLDRRRPPAYDGPAVPMPAPCPVCDVGVSEERFHSRKLAEKLKEPAWQTVYAESDGLCLGHLRLTLAMSDPEGRQWLLAETDARLQALQKDLAEYVRKHSWQFRDEPVSEAEGRSWVRAVAWLRGERPGDEGFPL